jgi:hypothetical protein
MNWIKMRSNLWDDPRIARICDLTGKKEAEVIGGLYWLWTMADVQTQDGMLNGLSTATIDRKTGVKGLGTALVKVGWVLETEEGIEIARFDEHNGASAKRRAYEAKRKQFVRTASEKCPLPMQTESGRGQELDKNRIDISPIVPTGDMILEVEECPKPEQPHPHLARLRELVRIQPSTPLDASASRAWEKNKKSAAALSEEDWRALEWAYRQKDGDAYKFRRKDLSTLLNNILAEVLRARQWAASAGVTPRAPMATVEPEGWREIVGTEYPEVNISTWAALPESMKNFVRHYQKQTAAA